MAPDNPATTLLAEYRAALEAASPLPWEVHVTAPGTTHEVIDVWRGDEVPYVAQDCDSAATAGFIAAAREAMPLLLAAVEAVLGLADGARIAMSACGVSGSCSCGQHPVAWNLDPAKVRETITSALAGTGKGAGDE